MTDVLQKNPDSAINASTSLKMSVGKGVLSVASKLPLVGGLFGMIDSAVDAVYSKYKAAKF